MRAPCRSEFVEAERKILGRSDGQLTALAGYAGGLSGAQNGNVCYHNAARVADYGSLGHAEVVRVRVPPSKFGDFAKEYAALFDSFGNRPDQSGDRGPEYRNLVGIPGGTSSPLATALVEASKASGDKLDFAAGRGNDADMRSLSWIMDSDRCRRQRPALARARISAPPARARSPTLSLTSRRRFPFFQAEQYHQFHDGFAWGEDYPNSYNGLGPKLVKAGAIKPSGCPNGMLGVGIAGL